MISNSNSLVTLKAQIQELFNFSVLCCNAVPSLKGYIKAVEKGAAPKIPDADHFKNSSFEELKGYIPDYRKQLGKYILLSSFSFFESYIQNLILEVIEYHGGKDYLLDYNWGKIQTAASNQTIQQKSNGLREYKKGGNLDKYRKINKELLGSSFLFPSDYFSFIGIQKLISLSIDDGFKSVQIPKIIEENFFLKLDDAEVDKFHSIRDTRNKIAHGDSSVEVNLSEATRNNKFLRNLAVKVDKQVVRCYFVIDL